MIRAAFSILWQPKAKRQLAKLEKVDRVQVWRAVDTLSELPWGSDVVALKSSRYGYRLRTGRFRVLFDFDGKLRIVSIEEVKKRDEQTY